MGNIRFIQLLPLFLCVLLYLKSISCSNLKCNETEKTALLNFKQGVTDPSDRLSSWVGDDCCSWDGVVCSNRTGRVIKLKLHNPSCSTPLCDRSLTAFSGEVSSSLLALEHLTYLDLSFNYFSGQNFPDFIGSFARLRYLNLSSASFGGMIPSSLGNLSRLLYLDLNTHNYLTDANVSDINWVSRLSSLKHLNLAGVNLSKADTDWFQPINRIPFLSEVHLFDCQLSRIPSYSQTSLNLTSLSVLDLSWNDFTSIIPDWIFNVSGLVHLNLGYNHFQGELADGFGKLSSLQVLDLSRNSLSRGSLPSTWGNLCSLTNLLLVQTNRTGEINDLIEGFSRCNTSHLEVLNLGYNELTGTLPESLGQLTNLKQFQVPFNSFWGSLPESIGNLSSLVDLDIVGNQMNGTIPESFGQLSSLIVMDLSQNFWQGNLTEAHMSNLSSLKELYLITTNPGFSLAFHVSSNWIPPFKLTIINVRSCPSGPEFPAWLRHQDEFTTVILRDAGLSGTIPDWFWKLDLQLDELDLSSNQLHGRVPNSVKYNQGAILDLSGNNFEGLLPHWSSNLSKLHVDNNRFSGPVPSGIGQDMPYLTHLYLSGNSLTGSIPLSIGKIESLENLALFGNFLSGDIPDFWNNLTNLIVIDMSGNRLSGGLPRSLDSLSQLTHLILSRNNLSGELPSFLQNCSSMRYMDFADNKFFGNFPSWISKFTSLMTIRTKSNLFTGNIPSGICNLSHLHTLDLSHNKFSGIIPPCIGNLVGFKTNEEAINVWTYQPTLEVAARGTVLEYTSRSLYLVNSIDFSSNNLTGTIPAELTNLTLLWALNLSMNHLTGRIPKNIGDLKRLESLDLSRNELSGSIPESMTSMTFLSHLDLSYNRLSGRIPSSNQFGALNNASIYEGNPGLCGAPLTRDCNDKHDYNVPQVDDKGDDDKLGKLWLFLSIVIGFAVGFWGVFGTIAIKRSWRITYFRAVDRATDNILARFTM